MLELHSHNTQPEVVCSGVFITSKIAKHAVYDNLDVYKQNILVVFA